MALTYFYLTYPFHLTYGYWVLIPDGMRTSIRFVVSMAIAYLVSRQVKEKGRRVMTQMVVFGISFVIPFIAIAIGDVKRQRHHALLPICAKISQVPIAVGPIAPTAVDGFLVATDYDEISNARRIDDLPEHRGLATIVGHTFDEMAQRALLEWRYSFIEFEMKLRSKQDRLFPGEYSNKGVLNSRDWSGDRYRLYYLAPRGHPHCLLPLRFDSTPTRGNEGAPSAVSPGDLTSKSLGQRQAAFPSEVATPSVDGKPSSSQPEFCLALEITSAPISKYRVQATDLIRTFPWSARTQGIQLPMNAQARTDNFEIVDVETSRPLAKHEGLIDRVDGKIVAHCGNQTLVEDTIGSTLKPNTSRDYYRKTSWYSNSAVANYFEPEQYPIADLKEPFEANLRGRDPGIPVRHQGTRCVEMEIQQSIEARVAELELGYAQRGRCAKIDNLRISCKYRKGHGPQETWTYDVCGRSGGSLIVETSYDPALHGGLPLESIPEYRAESNAQ